jgi:hypothetical protein
LRHNRGVNLYYLRNRVFSEYAGPEAQMKSPRTYNFGFAWSYATMHKLAFDGMLAHELVKKINQIDAMATSSDEFDANTREMRIRADDTPGLVFFEVKYTGKDQQ